MNPVLAFAVTTCIVLMTALGFLMMVYRRMEAEQRRLVNLASQLRAENHRLRTERSQLSTQLVVREDESSRAPASRPVLEREVYNIVTVGTTACGKTALTFKWAQPTFKLQELVATRFQRFERTVSRQWIPETNTLREHVFELLDWGGEFIGDAQSSLLKVGKIRALIMVVDVGEHDSPTGMQVTSRERVRYQIEQFNPYVLQLFFSEHIVEHCKTFILFINKADLLSGTWLEIERQARAMYKPLIDALQRYHGKEEVTIEVMVGSAQVGQNTHELYGYLIERILPREAYDKQLLARLSGEGEGTPNYGGATLISEPPVPSALIDTKRDVVL